MLNALLNLLMSFRMLIMKYRLWNPVILQTHKPLETQNRLLDKILAENKNTHFGQEHNFEKISSYQEFRQAVGIQSYEKLRPYIDKQEDEGEAYLNREQPVMYAQTSGTTDTPKYVPILEDTISDYKRSQKIFSYALYTSIPGVYDGKIMGIVSPAVEGNLETGTPFGSMSGLIYKSMPSIVRSKYVVPAEVFEIEDYELKYYLISAFALADENITLIGTANPTSILKIIKLIKTEGDQLIRDIKNGTLEKLLSNAKEVPTERQTDDAIEQILASFKSNPSRGRQLERIQLEKGNLTFADVWPNLKAIATWTNGSCRVLIPSIQNQLSSSTRIVELGYLSSEFRGNITLDVLNNQGIPTIDENFFEFVEQEEWESEQHNFLTIDQIEEGKQYYIFATTQNGLYRYFINDIIEVNGRFNNTPTIRFVQKGKGVTNITGEKLYENHLIEAIGEVKQNLGLDIQFFIMFAMPDNLQYHLYVELDFAEVQNDDYQPEIVKEVEESLCKLNIEYKSKRESQRLQPVKVTFLAEGTSEAYKRDCIENGQREAQFKIVHLQYEKDCSFDFDQQSL